MVARDEHERPPGAHDPPHHAGLQRRAAVGQVAGEQHRAVVGRALEDRDRQRVVVQVRGDREARRAGQRRPPGGLGDEPREADELRVELLVEHARGALGRVDRLQRARDVGAVRVVLRPVDLAARRQQHDERDPDPGRRHEHEPDRPAQPRPAPAPDRERHQQPERERAEHRHADQRPQVAGDRVARLPAHVLDVERAGLRDPLDRLAVDRAQVHPQPHGQPDRLEARAPVHERHVDVQRALVAGGDRQPDLADRQLLRLREGRQRAVRARQRGEQDGQEGERPPQMGQRRRSHSCMSETLR